MSYPLETGPQQTPRKPKMVVPILVGCAAFGVGVVLTFGYAQWQSQKQQLALMSQMVEQLQQPSQHKRPTADDVTRNAPLDLLAVAPTVAPAAQVAPTPAPQAEVIPAAVAVPAPEAGQAQSTADKIRELVSRSNDPLVSAALAQDAARRETMSVAIQGVNELVEAAVAGNYALTVFDEDQHLGLVFEGRREDQEQLEQLLASAAQADMIAFNPSVKGSDGSYDGRTILYDLVERALVHGTPDERSTGARIQQQALALLGTSNPAVAAAEPASDGGKVYSVKSGDSLAYIALQFYGNTNGYLKIYQANRDQLSSPDKIRVGQKLVIPSA